MIDWILLLVVLASAGAGYGLFKSMPVFGMVAGVVTTLLVVGLFASAVFGAAGFLAFFTAGWVLWLTTFALSYTVGTIVGAIF